MRLYPITRDMSENYVSFDRSQYPLIKMTFTGEAANDESFAAYLKGLKDNYNRKEKIALLFDASNAGLPSLKYQKQMAGWMKDNNALIKKYCIGIAYIVPQTMIRGALKMIFKFFNNPVPFEVCENEQAAIAWLNDGLKTSVIADQKA
ncbi:STAS/SEC14 domain-containing protein [Hyphobacterium sp. CCMP332]|nr:STAS/SEC14 domain-containing protein [Hyphobacterium sp. CCMP332]